jgi:hypothetical protein
VAHRAEEGAAMRTNTEPEVLDLLTRLVDK